MKIYTKTGDSGETGLFAGSRVAKDHPRIEAYGTVDELNAVIGMAIAENAPAEIGEILTQIQNDLFTVGAELATPDPAAAGTDNVKEPMIRRLEMCIDQFEETLEPLKQFILPSGTKCAAALHWARGVCRRAERCVITLTKLEGETISNNVVIYLNRLSDLLFVLARAANAESGIADTPWQKEET